MKPEPCVMCARCKEAGNTTCTNCGNHLGEKVKTGRLVAEGQGRTGAIVLQYYKCVDCQTSFPEIDGEIRCNRAPIVVCPYCEPDSKPFKNGRGPF